MQQKKEKEDYVKRKITKNLRELEYQLKYYFVLVKHIFS